MHFIRVVAIAVLASPLAGCESLSGPTATSRDVQLSAAQQNLYWNEVQRRVPAWFQQGGVEAPRLPSAESVYSAVQFVEVPNEMMSTCTFNKNTLEIRIGDDKWHSGCVPHELGHAVLSMIDHPCWNNFEHPNEVASRC